MFFPLAYKLRSQVFDEQSLSVIRRIFPTKQYAVLQIRQIAQQDRRIKKIIAFGSATTMQCGVGSDLDIAITADVSDSDFPYEICRQFSSVSSELDIIDYKSVHSLLLKNNIDKGVTIYAVY